MAQYTAVYIECDHKACRNHCVVPADRILPDGHWPEEHPSPLPRGWYRVWYDYFTREVFLCELHASEPRTERNTKK